MNDDFQLRLAAAFPAHADAELIRGFREGILLADGLLDSEPFLQNMIGRDLRGHLRRAGILYRIHDLCRLGDLPFEAAIGRMPRGSWHWLEIRADRFVAHLCRTESALTFPEDTATRQEERFLNQNDLFEPNVISLREELDCARGLAAWLTFGGDAAGQLQHLCWAMPSSDGQEWLAHINVLRRAASTGTFQEAEKIAPKSLRLRFKEHIEESLTQKPRKGDGSA